MIDQIGGWSTAGVGQSYGEVYGEGYPLEVLAEWIRKIEFKI